MHLARFAPLLILVLFATSAVSSQAQPTDSSALTGKWQVEGSSGYFTPGSDRSDPGYLVSFAVGRHLSTGFLVSGELAMAQTYERYRDDNPFFPGNRRYSTHYIFRLRFQYPIQLGDRHRLSINSGIMYRRFYENFEGEPIQSDFAGLIAGIQYGFDLRPVRLGLRLDSHIRYDDGVGDYIAAPFIALEM
jgi:hypothetical protein